jgi:hypothetical protein
MPHSRTRGSIPAASISTTEAPELRKSRFSSAVCATRSMETRVPLAYFPRDRGTSTAANSDPTWMQFATKTSPIFNAGSRPPQNPVLTTASMLPSDISHRAASNTAAASLGPAPLAARTTFRPFNSAEQTQSTGQSSFFTDRQNFNRPLNSRASAATNNIGFRTTRFLAPGAAWRRGRPPPFQFRRANPFYRANC